MGRCLIVANQTLGGAELETGIRARIERGDGRFFVLVPMIQPELEIATWAPADPMFGMPVRTEINPDALIEARKRSDLRLQVMLDKIIILGGQAAGEVGNPDPASAVAMLLERESFDEVIVSTLPAGISRWVRMDLPSRIGRLVSCPVVTIEAEE